MPRYKYEALDPQGHKTRGVIEASSEEEAVQGLNDLGVQLIWVSSPRWISPQSTLVQISKVIAALCLMAVFGATAVITMSLPSYWEAIHLEGDKGRLTNATVTERDPDSTRVVYEYEVEGERYQGEGRHEDNADGPLLAVGDLIEVLYSAQKPSIHRLYKGKRPDSAAMSKPVTIATAVDLLALFVLFAAASWEHAYNVRVSLGAGMPLPTREAKKILNNALCTPLFPMIFACIFTLADDSTFYAAYRFHIVGATFALAALAILLHVFSPFRSAGATKSDT